MHRLIKILIVGLVLAPATTAGAGAAYETYVAQDQEAPGSIEVVGHERLEMRGMNAALAVHNGYAYIGSRTDNHGQGNAGVMVVDVKNPAEPKIVSKIEEPYENN